MKIVLIYVLMTLVDAQQPDTATTKRPPPGYSPQAWRPPAGGWALNSIKNNLPHPQDERLYCQNGILKDTEKPYYPYLCDPEGLLPPTSKYMLCYFTACIGVAVFDILRLLFQLIDLLLHLCLSVRHLSGLCKTKRSTVIIVTSSKSLFYSARLEAQGHHHWTQFSTSNFRRKTGKTRFAQYINGSSSWGKFRHNWNQIRPQAFSEANR